MSDPLSPPPESLPQARYQVVLAGVCALILTVGLARFAYTPMLPVMRNQAGLSYLGSGWLATVNYAGYMSGALLASMISNLNLKFVLYRFGLVLALLGTAGMGLTQDMALWLLLRFIAGLSSTAGMLLGSGLVLNWLIRQRHRPQLGLHFAGLGLGIVVSGLAVAAMAQGLAWDQQWLALGLLGVVFWVPAWRWMPAPAAQQGNATALPPETPPRRWMTLFMAVYFCAGFGFAIGATFIVAILEKLPLFAGNGGWVWVVVGLAAAPSSFVWDRVAHAIRPIAALLLGFGLQLVSLLLPAISDNPALNLLSAVLFGGTFVGIVNLTLTLIGRRFPANPAKAMARMTLSYGVAQILAPAMAGAIAAASGSYRDALLVAAAFLGLGMVLLVLLARQADQTPAADQDAG